MDGGKLCAQPGIRGTPSILHRHCLEMGDEELNRYARTKVRIEDSALAAERISGSFYVGQEEDIVGSLVIMFSLETERNGDEILLSPPSPSVN